MLTQPIYPLSPPVYMPIRRETRERKQQQGSRQKKTRRILGHDQQKVGQTERPCDRFERNLFIFLLRRRTRNVTEPFSSFVCPVGQLLSAAERLQKIKRENMQCSEAKAAAGPTSLLL